MIVVFELNDTDPDYFHIVKEITNDELEREIGEPYLHQAYTDHGIAWLGRKYSHPDNHIELYVMDVRIADPVGFYPDPMHRVVIENLRDLRIKYLIK